jgi:hypothetical protein
VLFAGNQYWEPEPEVWRELLGSDVSAHFAKPLLYTIPFGSGIFVALCALFVAKKRLLKTDVQKVQTLLKDNRYRTATETLFGSVHENAVSNSNQLPYEDRFLEAVRYLVEQGVPAAKAQNNLHMIAHVIQASRQQQIDQLLAVAAQLEQQSEWDKSLELYKNLIDQLPAGDPHARYAEERIAAITENQAAVQT